MASVKYEVAASASLATTDLNALASGSGILCSTVYDNSGTGGLQYLYGFFELNVTFGTAPTLNNLVNLYLIPSLDGTNYSDTVNGATPFAPMTTYAGGFPVRAVTTAQRILLGGPGAPFLIPLPPLKFKAYVINNAGQAFPASGSTLNMVPYRYQVV